MRIEFTYRLEDVKELLFPEARFAIRRRRGRLAKWILTSAVLLLWLAAMVITLTSLWMSDDSQYPAQNLLADLLPSYLPALFIFLFFGSLFFRLWRNSHRRPAADTGASKRNKPLRVFLSCVIFFGVGCAGVLVLSPYSAITWHPGPHQMILIGLAPWAVNFLFAIVLVRAHRRWRSRAIWLAKSSLARPKMVELDENGFHMTDELTHIDLKWPVFTRARETPNLLVLVSADNESYMVPKRALTHADGVEQLRAILQNHIVDTRFSTVPSGFAVLSRPVLPLDPAEAAGGEQPPADTAPIGSSSEIRRIDPL